MFKLRQYQQELVDDIVSAWSRVRVVLAVLATGGGKTVIFSWIIRNHVGASAAVVHRKEIVAQISMALARLGVKHRVIAPPDVVRRIRRKQLRDLDVCYVDQHAQCGVVSVQTLASKSSQNDRALCAWVAQITLGVFDEGHHYVASGSWAVAVEMLSRAKLLLVTATPKRADGKGLGAEASGFVEEMVEGPCTEWLISRGFLSPFKYFAPASDLDVSDLAVTASGDFNARAMRERVVDSHLIGDVVSHYLKYAQGQRFIVFNTDVLTAEETAEAFRVHGVSCQALSGKTEAGERDRVLDLFERGEIQGLTNVDLFDEGFDVPAVVAVILARPTQSLAKFLQMIGRSLRTMDGKSHAIIIDPVRNWERHGMPDWPRVWALADESREGRASSDDTVPQRVCLSCTQPYEAFFKACPYCGYVLPPADRTLVEHVDGDLLELDVEAMAALFAAREQANATDEDFLNGLVSRRVPEIGRPRLVRNHRAAKYRREVLQNLVGWWLGCQPAERDVSEKYRRFYYRFGIDMSTAFTLNTTDTDALIARITRGFHYDNV